MLLAEQRLISCTLQASDAPESPAAKKMKATMSTDAQPIAAPQDLPRPETAAADTCISGQTDAAACQNVPCTPHSSSKVLSDAHRASPPPMADTLDWVPSRTLAAAHQHNTIGNDLPEKLDTAQAQPQADSLALQLEPDCASDCEETVGSKAVGILSLAQAKAHMAHADSKICFTQDGKASCDYTTGTAAQASEAQASICCLKDMLSLINFDLTPVPM